jgi:hypothetical protein
MRKLMEGDVDVATAIAAKQTTPALAFSAFGYVHNIRYAGSWEYAFSKCGCSILARPDGVHEEESDCGGGFGISRTKISHTATTFVTTCPHHDHCETGEIVKARGRSFEPCSFERKFWVHQFV